MLLIFFKKNLEVYITKVSKYKKKTNNSMYRLFKEFLRVLILQVRFSRPFWTFAVSFGHFGTCDESGSTSAVRSPTNMNL